MTNSDEFNADQSQSRAELCAEDQLCMIQPHDLSPNFALTSAASAEISPALQTFQQVFSDVVPAKAIPQLKTALQQLGPVEMAPMPNEFPTGTTLKSEHAEIVDGLMDIRHVISPEPAKVVTTSLLKAGQACLELLHVFPEFEAIEAERLKTGFAHYGALLARVCGLEEPLKNSEQDTLGAISPTVSNGNPMATLSAPGTQSIDPKVDYLWVWVKGHWLFLTLIQGLTLSLRRFGLAAKNGLMAEARLELDTATQLMWASGASMKMAGNFEKQIYQEVIRAMMMVGHEKARVDIEVSGIMFWDHHYLVNIIWKQEIRDLLRALPLELADAHTAFVEAYRDGLSTGHVDVCARFGGRESTSLLSSNAMAVEFLESIGQTRLRQIDPLARVGS